jgi:hypothetical protein
MSAPNDASFHSLTWVLSWVMVEITVTAASLLGMVRRFGFTTQSYRYLLNCRSPRRFARLPHAGRLLDSGWNRFVHHAPRKAFSMSMGVMGTFAPMQFIPLQDGRVGVKAGGEE